MSQHRVQTMLDVQRMHAAGWHPYGIKKVLEHNGVSVHLTTIRKWTDPEYADRRNAAVTRHQRERRLREATVRPRGSTPEYKFARLKALKAAGLSDTATGKVLGLDFGRTLTRDQVARALERGEWPRFYNKTSETVDA